MDPRSAYFSLDAEPKFSALDYETQIKVRRGIAQAWVGQNPKFMQLDFMTQNRVMDQLSIRPPALVDRKKEAIFRSMVAAVDRGDQQAIQNMQAFVSNRATATGGVLSNLLLRLAGGAVGVAGAMSGMDLKKIKEMQKVANIEYLTNSDADRMSIYLAHRAQQEPKGPYAAASKLATVSAVGAGILDAVPFYIAAPNAVSASVLKALGPAIARTAGVAKTVLLRSFVPQVAETLAAGLIGIAKQNAIAALARDPQRFTDTGKEIWRAMADGAVADFVFGMIGREIIPPLFSLMKSTFRGVGKTAETGVQLSGKSIDELIDQITSGHDVAPALKRTMNYVGQVRDNFNQNLSAAMSRGFGDLTLRPLDRTYMAAQSMGNIVFHQTADGAFETFFINRAKNTVASKTFKTLGGLQDELAEQAYGMYLRAPGKEAGEFLQGNQWLLRRGSSIMELDSVIAARSAPDLATGMGLKGKFISASDRNYISALEADRIAKSLSANGITFRTDLGEIDTKQLERFLHGNAILPGDAGPRIVKEAANGNAVVVLRNVADAETVAAVDTLVAKTIKKSPEMAGDAADLRRGYLLEAGFDGVKLPDGSYEALLPNRIKLLVSEVDKVGRVSAARFTAKGASVDRASVRMTSGEVVPLKKVGKDATRFTEAMQGTFYGKVDDQKARRVLGAAMGLTPEDLKTTRFEAKSSARGWTFEIDDLGGSRIVHYPANIPDPSTQKSFIESFIRTMSKETGWKGKAAITAQNVAKNMVPASFLRPFTDAGDVVKKYWYQDLAKMVGGDLEMGPLGNSYRLTLGGDVFESKVFSEIQNRMAATLLDEGAVMGELSARGWSVKKVGTGFEMSRGAEVIRVNSAAEAAHAAGVNAIRLPNRYAPSVVVTPSAIGLEYANSTLTGTTADVLKQMGGFIDTGLEGRLKAYTMMNGMRVRKYVDTGAVSLSMPHLGAEIPFANLADARDFLAKVDVHDMSVARQLGARKGLHVDFDSRRGYLVYDGKGMRTAKDWPELNRIFAEIPDGVGTRDIFDGLDTKLAPDTQTALKLALEENPELFAKWEASSLDARPAAWDGDVEVEIPATARSNEFTRNIKYQTETFDWYRDSVTKRLELPGLKEVLVRQRASMDVSNVAQLKATKLLEAIYSEGTGRKGSAVLISPARRGAVLELVEAGPEGSESWARVMAEHGKIVEKSDFLRVEQLRRFLGERIGTNTTGMARKFAVPWQDFVEKYMPRIRDKLNTAEGIKMLDNSVKSEDFLKWVYPEGVPSELHVWFENTRTAELAQFARDRDGLSVMLRYTAAGHRKIYMQDSWRELSEYLRVNKASIPKDVRDSIDRYMAISIGIHKPQGVLRAEEAGVGIMRMLGATEEQSRKGRDIMKLYFSLTYAGTMGYRPMTAIRNAAQVFSTFAARFGNDYTVRAITELEKRGPEYIARLRNLGILPGTAPIVNELMTVSTKIGRFTTKALGWFKNADEFSRSVAYLAVDMRFTEALEKLQKGVFKGTAEEASKAFQRYAGLHLIGDTNPDVVKKALSALRDGVGEGGKISSEAISQAKFLFGSEVVRQTMFDWSALNQPGFFSSGLLGKLFGRYGSYAAGYRANIYRALSNGTTADKAAFIARFVGNNLAIKGMMTAAGVSAMDFTPGLPALFGGGPDFDIMMNLLSAPKTNYQGAQARQNLLRGQWLPGSMQFRFAAKGLKFLEQGDAIGALWSFSMTPTSRVLDPEK